MAGVASIAVAIKPAAKSFTSIIEFSFGATSQNILAHQVEVEQMPCLSTHDHSRSCERANKQQGRSTTIPATIVSFNRVASIHGTVAVKH
jgi:hypothetical protein